MAEFDDLLAGIRAFPADELRRLVFADWLDENAHAHPVYAPWASYIRWAIAATRTHRTDPDYWKYRRYPERPPKGVAKLLGVDALPVSPEWTGGFPDTLTFSTDTLQEHDRRLTTFAGPIRRLTVQPRTRLADLPLPEGYPAQPPPPPLPPVPTRWVTGPTVARAGALDVSSIDIDAAALLAALAARAGALPPLSLTLSVAVPEIAAALADLPFPSLVGLAVRGLLDPDRLAASANLGGVKSFTVGTMTAEPGRFRLLAERLPNLTRLNVDDASRPEFLRALADGHSPGLSHLEMAAVPHEAAGWADFAGSPAFARLTRLHWSGSGTPDTSAAVWPAGVAEPEAGDLILNTAHLGPLRSPALFGSPLLHRCSCLFAENCVLTPDAYVALAGNPSARNLKVVSIQRPFKSDPVASGRPFAALCRSPHLAGLTELSLTFHYLTDDDFGELLNATFADNLRYLNLAGSYFSERMLARLLDPDVMPELAWLDIHGPKGSSHSLGVAYRERFGPNFAF